MPRFGTGAVLLHHHHRTQRAGPPIRDRMPLILPPDAYLEWMDPRNEHTGGLLELLAPLRPGQNGGR
jgi:hypothetical protein